MVGGSAYRGVYKRSHRNGRYPCGAVPVSWDEIYANSACKQLGKRDTMTEDFLMVRHSENIDFAPFDDRITETRFVKQ